MNTIINWIGEGSASAVVMVLVSAYALSAYLVLKLVFGAFRRCGDPTLPVPIFLVLAGWGCLARMIVSLTASWAPVSMDDFLDVVIVLIGFCPIFEILAGCFVFALVRCLLPKVDLRKIRRMPAGRPYRRNGRYLFVAAILTAIGNLLTVCFLICLARGFVREREAWHVAVIVIFGAMVQCPVVIWIFKKAREYFRYAKICNESGRTLAALGVRHAPILFLRSFKIDVIVDGMSFDEYVCSKFADSDTPILSLCDPDEDVPSGGSIKLQARDERWRELILKIIPFCRAVVMYEGMTNGLNWEIATIRERVAPCRFFVASPPVRYRVSAWYGCGGGSIGFHRIFSRKGIQMAYEFVWSRFKAKMGQSKIAIPEHPIPDESLVSFASGWDDPRVVKCNVCSGVIGKVLELTKDDAGRDCDYSEIAAVITEFERQSELPKLVRDMFNRVKRFFLGFMVIFPLLVLGIVYVVKGIERCSVPTVDENKTAIESIFREHGVDYNCESLSNSCFFTFTTCVTNDASQFDMIVRIQLGDSVVAQSMFVLASEELDRKCLLSYVNHFNQKYTDLWMTFFENGNLLCLKHSISLGDLARKSGEEKTEWILQQPKSLISLVAKELDALVNEEIPVTDVKAADL